LFQVVAALGAAGRLPRRLHGREQQGDQDRDDGDDNQQLDQCESGPALVTSNVAGIPKRAVHGRGSSRLEGAALTAALCQK
jgi:hypothetical protein